MPPRHPKHWNDLTWPADYPLSLMEMSFLLPHLVREQDRRLDVYFTRVYNPVWTNPDGFSWIEMLSDPGRIGLHVRADPHLERDRLLRRLRPADGPLLGAPRPDVV